MNSVGVKLSLSRKEWNLDFKNVTSVYFYSQQRQNGVLLWRNGRVDPSQLHSRGSGSSEKRNTPCGEDLLVSETQN